MMKKSTPAASPAKYVAALRGWQKKCVVTLRTATLTAGVLDEKIKWGHLVYFSNGPVLLIRAEETRVLFGFWRGQRLVSLEPRLKPGGKYEMATMEVHADTKISQAAIKRLAKAAMALNASEGDPTAILANPVQAEADRVER